MGRKSEREWQDRREQERAERDAATKRGPGPAARIYEGGLLPECFEPVASTIVSFRAADDAAAYELLARIHGYSGARAAFQHRTGGLPPPGMSAEEMAQGAGLEIHPIGDFPANG